MSRDFYNDIADTLTGGDRHLRLIANMVQEEQ